MLEESLVGVPALVFGLVPEQREIQALGRVGTFIGQLGSDALVFFQAGDLVARRTTIVANQREALVLQVGVVHVVRVGIRSVGVFAGHQVAGDIAGFILGQPQAGHGGHLLHLQFVAVIGALGVLQVEHIRQV